MPPKSQKTSSTVKKTYSTRKKSTAAPSTITTRSKKTANSLTAVQTALGNTQPTDSISKATSNATSALTSLTSNCSPSSDEEQGINEGINSGDEPEASEAGEPINEDNNNQWVDENGKPIDQDDINQWVFEDEPEEAQDEDSSEEDIDDDQQEDQLQEDEDEIDLTAEIDFEPNPLKRRVKELKEIRFRRALYTKEKNELRKLEKLTRPNIVCITMFST